MSQKEHLIMQLEESLARNKVKYEQAKEAMPDVQLKPFLDLIYSYHKGDSPESAVFILAQCQALFTPIKEVCNTIFYYEQEAARLRSLTE